MEEQIKQAWRTYYEAIADGHPLVAKKIFERIEAMVNVQLCRKTTTKMLAVTAETLERVQS